MMITHRRLVLSLTLFALGAPVATRAGGPVDADGCWNGLTPTRAPCMTLDSSESSTTTPGKVITKWRNACDQRIYATFCNQRTNGTWECGSEGITPGSVHTWATMAANGKHDGWATGSVTPSKDWVCAGKVPNWDRH
jgi:hypothetical protein